MQERIGGLEEIGYLSRRFAFRAAEGGMYEFGMSMKHYKVVAAVICHENKLLCMQKGRTKFDYTSFKFEFPGGKIEPGESPQEALKRELLEEMDYAVSVGDEVACVEHVYPDFSITLTAFWCTADSPSFRMKEHVAYEWRTVESLPELDWAAADVGIVKAICRS